MTRPTDVAGVGWRLPGPRACHRLVGCPGQVASLLVSALAVAQPREAGPFPPPDLVELVRLDPTIKLDVRYATPNNFVHRKVYDEARAFLQRPAAQALLSAHRALRDKGYGILVFDGYRPWSVTRLFWDLTPPAERPFVANPAKGSVHNRGCAADVSLFDLRTGREVEMPSPYDETSERASPSYGGGTAEQRARRDLLRRTLEGVGFTVEPNEWWHYNLRGCRYAILDVPFSAIAPAPAGAAPKSPP